MNTLLASTTTLVWHASHLEFLFADNIGAVYVTKLASVAMLAALYASKYSAHRPSLFKGEALVLTIWIKLLSIDQLVERVA